MARRWSNDSSIARSMPVEELGAAAGSHSQSYIIHRSQGDVREEGGEGGRDSLRILARILRTLGPPSPAVCSDCRSWGQLDSSFSSRSRHNLSFAERSLHLSTYSLLRRSGSGSFRTQETTSCLRPHHRMLSAVKANSCNNLHTAPTNFIFYTFSPDNVKRLCHFFCQVEPRIVTGRHHPREPPAWKSYLVTHCR